MNSKLRVLLNITEDNYLHPLRGQISEKYM